MDTLAICTVPQKRSRRNCSVNSRLPTYLKVKAAIIEHEAEVTTNVLEYEMLCPEIQSPNRA